MFIFQFINSIAIIFLLTRNHPCSSQDLLLDQESGKKAAFGVEMSMKIIGVVTPVDLIRDVGNNIFHSVKQDEILDEIRKRTGNCWDPGYTAISIGFDENSTLSPGKLLKIAREEHYWKNL